MPEMKIKIDGEVEEVREVYPRGQSANVATVRIGRREFVLAEDSETAGEAVADYYRDMRKRDPKEFKCLIGEKRLIAWGCGESDDFGISSFDEFLEIVANHPEEHFAGYDGVERDCEIAPDWAGEVEPDYFECGVCAELIPHQVTLHPYNVQGECKSANKLEGADIAHSASYLREWVEENEPNAEIITSEELNQRLEWDKEDSELNDELGFTPTVAYRAN